MIRMIKTNQTNKEYNIRLMQIKVAISTYVSISFIVRPGITSIPSKHKCE